jgi:hypothetical protein
LKYCKYKIIFQVDLESSPSTGYDQNQPLLGAANATNHPDQDMPWTQANQGSNPFTFFETEPVDAAAVASTYPFSLCENGNLEN